MKFYQSIKEHPFFETLKHGSIYSLVALFNNGLAFITIPIFTKYLTTEEYGKYEVIMNSCKFFGLIATLNLQVGLMRYIYDKDRDKQILTNATVWLCIFLLALGITIIYPFKNAIFGWVNIPNAPHLLLLILLTQIAIMLFNIFNTITIQEEKSKENAFVNIAYNLLKTIVAIVLIIFVSQTYLSRLWGEALIGVVFSLYMLFRLTKHIKLADFKSINYEYVRYSIGLAPVVLSALALSYFDTLLINTMCGNGEAGIYAYTYKLIIIFAGISAAFNSSLRNKVFAFYHVGKREEAHHIHLSNFKLVSLLLLATCLFLPEVTRLITRQPSYLEGFVWAPILFAGAYSFEMVEVFNVYLLYAKKNRIYVYSFFVACAVNIGANYLLLPYYGYPVAAFITFFSYLLLFLMVIILIQRDNISCPKLTPFLQPILLTFLALFLAWYVDFQRNSLVFTYLVKTCIFISYFLTLYNKVIRNRIMK
jgi:O-antigen/teichoic acid export membrane protein